jgi:hypothetical protein
MKAEFGRRLGGANAGSPKNKNGDFVFDGAGGWEQKKIYICMPGSIEVQLIFGREKGNREQEMGKWRMVTATAKREGNN